MRNVARSWIGWLLVALLVIGSGTAVADLPTLIRKKSPPSAKKPPTMNGLARLVTNLEDELKKYGTITVKSPDVWGETTLMSMVQEYERYMRVDAANFQAGMQGYLARSDQAGLQAQLAIGNSTPTNNSVVSRDTIAVPVDVNLMAPPGTPFNTLPSSGVTLSLEPTEQTREHSVFLKVNQALRRTNLGDDNSRQPGYTSYVVRFPVSVLPGRETYKGCAAVITIRARLALEQNHLHDTFPRLAISDFAARTAPWLVRNWDADTSKVPAAIRKYGFSDNAPGNRVGSPTMAVDDRTMRVLYGDDNLNCLLDIVKVHFASQPKADQLEAYVFALLLQLQGALEAQGVFSTYAGGILELESSVARGCLNEIQSAQLKALASLTEFFGACKDDESSICLDDCDAPKMAALTWLLLAQSALLDRDIKRLVEGQAGTCKMPIEELRFFEPAGDGYAEASAVWKQLIESMFPVHIFTLDPVVEQQNYVDAFSRRRELQLAMATAVAKGEMRAAAAVRFTRQLSMDMLTVGLNRTAVAFAHDNDTFGWYFYPRLQSPPTESSNIAALARLIWSTGPTRRYDLCNRQLEPGMRECEAVIVMPAFVPSIKIDITTNWERLVKPGAIKVDYVKMVNEAAKIQQAMHYSAGVQDQECYRPEDYDILCSRVEQLEKMLPLQQQFVRLPFPYVLGGSELFDNGNLHLPPQLKEYYGIEWLPMAKGDARPAEAAKAPASANILSNVVNNAASAEATATTAAAADAKKTDPAAGAGAVYLFISGRHFHPTQTHVIAGGVKSDSIDATPIQVVARAETFTVSAPPAAAAATGATAVKTTELTPVMQTPTVADVVVISRELLRVKLTGINPQLSNCCVSVYVATPAGVSNALVIPLQGTCPEACRPRPAGSGATANDCCQKSPNDVEGEFYPGKQPAGASALFITTEKDEALAKLVTPTPKVKAPEIDVSLSIRVEGRGTVVCVPMSGAKLKLAAKGRYVVTVAGISITDKLAAAGVTIDGVVPDLTVGYVTPSGLRCLCGHLGVLAGSPATGEDEPSQGAGPTIAPEVGNPLPAPSDQDDEMEAPPPDAPAEDLFQETPNSSSLRRLPPGPAARVQRPAHPLRTSSMARTATATDRR